MHVERSIWGCSISTYARAGLSGTEYAFFHLNVLHPVWREPDSNMVMEKVTTGRRKQKGNEKEGSTEEEGSICQV